ncbi:hypothetical protein LSPCS325_15850 [Lysinibacillus sp. CTST325]
MAEYITKNIKNHVNKAPHNEHDKPNNKAMSSKKITKECVDQLIEITPF